MLVFVIPLKSLRASNSWALVCRLFERCIKSVCNQTSPNFKVIVVCHEKPNIDFSHPQITYVEVNYPIPENPNIQTKRRDRVRKVLIGVVYAQEYQPSHLMKVDADDCVSQHLAEFVDQHPDNSGWLMNQGYEYQEGSKFIYLRNKKFYLHCGTSNIIKYGLLDFPENPESLKYDTLFQYHVPHSKIVKMMVKKEITLNTLPFPGAVYVIKNGENTYLRNQKLSDLIKKPNAAIIRAKEIYKAFNSQVLDQSIRDEFGLYDISRVKSF